MHDFMVFVKKYSVPFIILLYELVASFVPVHFCTSKPNIKTKCVFQSLVTRSVPNIEHSLFAGHNLSLQTCHLILPSRKPRSSLDQIYCVYFWDLALDLYSDVLQTSVLLSLLSETQVKIYLNIISV